MPSPDACRAWHPDESVVCGRVPGHRGEHAGNCSCGFLLFWPRGAEAAPADYLNELSTNLSTIIDWLRQDCTARHADDMADVVYMAWQIIDDLADPPHVSPATQAGEKTAGPGPTQ